MHSPKKQKVLDKTRTHSVTANSDVLTLPVLDNEEQLNTNVDEEQASRNLKIKKLNHDCLAQVLMHLSVLDRLEMEKVCKKWKEAAEMSSYNFKKINFNDLKITLDKKEETWKIILEKYGRYLKDLTISYEYSWICDVITKECRNITRFDIDMIPRNENDEEYLLEFLLQAVNSMPKLKYLNLRIKTCERGNFFIRLLELLPSDIEEIHLLASLDYFYYLRQKTTISVVPDKFTSLRCLTLHGFRLDQSIMELILLNANTLVHLNLARCNSTPDSSIFSKLCNLEYLNLYRITNPNFHVITAIAHNCQKLNHFEYADEKYLDFEHEEMKIVPQHVFSELKYLKNLEYINFYGLDIYDYDDSFLSPITNNCKKLKHLNVDEGLDFSASDIKEITKLKNLESLNLNGAEIDSKSLIEVENNCLELKDLSTCFDYVSETALEKLSNLKKLEKLEFSNCQNLTGDLLINIINNCENLIDLDLFGCHNVTEASLLQVGKLQNLKRLRINFIKNIRNAMFDNFRKLEYLSCAACPSVTDEGIMKILDNCQNLHYLNIIKSGVSVETLIYAAKRPYIFKKLRIIVSDPVRQKYYSENAFKSPYLNI